MAESEINRLKLNQNKSEIIENNSKKEKENNINNNKTPTQEKENNIKNSRTPTQEKEVEPKMNEGNNKPTKEEKNKKDEFEYITVYSKQIKKDDKIEINQIIKNDVHHRHHHHRHHNENYQNQNQHHYEILYLYDDDSQMIFCPYCKCSVMTRVENEFNFLSCFTCLSILLFFVLIIWCLIFLKADPPTSGDYHHNLHDTHYHCNRCDCCCLYCCINPNGQFCYDTNHYCPNCGNFIGKNDSLRPKYLCCRRC